MNAPLATATAPLRAIMRSFEFTSVATTAPAIRTSVSPLARRAAPLANRPARSASAKSKIQNRKS